MNDKQNKQNVKEGVSGAIPMVSFASELGGVVFLAATLLLPVVFEKIRMTLTSEQVKSFAKKVVEAVKGDASKDSLKMKISRAINDVIQKTTGGKVSSVQQDVLNVLPNDIESKPEEKVSNEIKKQILGLKNPGSRNGRRF
jgi:hypothetical protein